MYVSRGCHSAPRNAAGSKMRRLLLGDQEQIRGRIRVAYFHPTNLSMTTSGKECALLAQERIKRDHKFDGHDVPGYEPMENHVNEHDVPWFQAYDFFKDRENLGRSVELARKFAHKKTLVVIAHGGSITSTKAVYVAMSPIVKPERELRFIDSPEPYHIMERMAGLNPEDTLIVVVSKSGATIDNLEEWPYLRSLGFTDAVLITAYEGKTLYLMGKELKIGDNIIMVPETVGGRYSLRTAGSYFPLYMAFGVDAIKDIERGTQETYPSVDTTSPVETNTALQTATHFFMLGDPITATMHGTRTLDQIFCPVYTHALDGAHSLLMQLQHESSCKLGRGQTLLVASGPECQHHTNVRVFGGEQNMGVLFVVPASTGEHVVCIPKELRKEIGGLDLGKLHGNTLEEALFYEYLGTMEASAEQKIPSATVVFPELSFRGIGNFMAFAHYAFGVYPASIRNVNPFDQPDVEASKRIGRDLRMGRIQD